MIYVYAKLSENDFHLFRTPGPGLGNILFPWARAFVAAEELNGYLIEPTWRNIKLGTFIRREPDKRTYGDIFKHRLPSKFLNDLYVKSFCKRHLCEDNVNELQGLETDVIVKFQGMKNYFYDIRTKSKIISAKLTKIAKQQAKQYPNYIALHIRCGDFASGNESEYTRNSRVSPHWFIQELKRIRTIKGDLPAIVFTDDPSGEVKNLFKNEEGIEFSDRRANALQDILSIASTSHIICSNSTFSLWGAFLSEGTTSAKFPKLYRDYQLDSNEFSLRII